MLKAEKICKNFQEVKALDDVSLEAKPNEIFGIIGPDGAGKSTFFRIATTLLLPDSGKCEIFGFDVQKDFLKLRKITGYMPGNFSLYMDLSVEENLKFFAGLCGVNLKENYYLIESIYSALLPFKNRYAKSLSGGMKQKLALCCALIRKPKILFLDEPTTGVDAVSRQEFWEILQNLKEEMGIIVSTPYMDEASLCDKIALMHGGKILKVNSPKQLCQEFSSPLFELVGLEANALKTIRQCACVRTCYLFGQAFHITFNEKNREDFHAILQQNQATLKPIKPSVEDCFMELLQ